MGWIVVLVIFAVVVSGRSARTTASSPAQQVRNAFAQIDVQLKRRYDLIPISSRLPGLHEARARDARERHQGTQHGGERHAAASADPGSASAIHGLCGRGCLSERWRACSRWRRRIRT